MPEMKITLYDTDEDVEVEHTVPALWAICARCEGKGHSTPDGLRGHVYTQEDFDREGPELHDFCNDLGRGFYDEGCRHCNGSGKVLVPDVSRMGPDLAKVYVKQLRNEMEHRAICRNEAAMMAGMAGDMESYNYIRSER